MDRQVNDPQYIKESEDALYGEGSTVEFVEVDWHPQQGHPQQQRQEPLKQASPKQEQRREFKERFPDVLDAGDDLEKPPPRAWLLGNVFCREFLSSLFGDGGIGKTALRYAQYLSLAIGRSLTGEHVFQWCRVLIVSLEDNDVELRRRIWALRIHYNIKPEELKGRLFLWAPQAKDGKLMTVNRFGNAVEGALGDSIKALITHYDIDLVGIDPFIKSHGVGENNNNAIDMVVQVLTNMCAEFHIAIDVPHHVSKSKVGAGNEPGDANRGRGGQCHEGRCACCLYIECNDTG
jgi:RecA-family ATPase